jgi:hypothetical protein
MRKALKYIVDTTIARVCLVLIGLLLALCGLVAPKWTYMTFLHDSKYLRLSRTR